MRMIAGLRPCSRTRAGGPAACRGPAGARSAASGRSSRSTMFSSSHCCHGRLSTSSSLDLVVVDDAALLLVDQEDLARLQPPLLGDVRRVDRQHADFAGHDDQVVLGDVIAAGAQAVAVEHRADDRAVGERDARPGRPTAPSGRRGIRRTPAGPGPSASLFCQASGIIISTECGSDRPLSGEELQAVVEAWPSREPDSVRIGNIFCSSSPKTSLLQRAGAGAHPVAVAAQGVDLAVVGDVAVRVGAVPGGEGVGAEAAVDDRQAS